MAPVAPRLLAALAVVAAALGASARASATSCIRHAYEHMQLELSGVYRGDTAVPRPAELPALDELLNSGDQGKSALLWEKATMAGGKFYRLVDEQEPTPAVGRYLRAVAQRRLMTACRFEIPFTPILPGRYAFEQEHLGGEKVSLGIDDPELLVTPGRDRVELRFALRGARYRAVYQVRCAFFDWKQNAPTGCAVSEPGRIDGPVKPDAPSASAPAPAAPAPSAPAAPHPPGTSTASVPPVQPAPGGCGGCATGAAGQGGWPALALAAGLAAGLGGRRRGAIRRFRMGGRETKKVRPGDGGGGEGKPSGIRA